MAKYLVIGGVAGGASFAAKMRRLDEKAEITVFEKGPYVSYANCGLPYYIGGTIKEEAELILHTPASLHERFNIDVLVNTEVVAINRDKKTVTAKSHIDGSEKEYEYDKLMLAPGGTAVVPPIEGINLPGIFTIRDVDDTKAIKAFVVENKPKTAAVIGGGFIGLEMAENLYDNDIKVTLVEAADQVMAPLDYEMSVILHHHMREKGIDLRLKSALKSIKQKDGMLELDVDGDKVVVDMVILGIGVRPNTALAKAAGLEIGSTGGIRTNEYMQTSDENIYASGDAVEVVHKVTGKPALIALAGNANKQARIAAEHIAGKNKKIRPVIGSSVVKVFDFTAAMTGANEKLLKAAGIECDKVYLHPNSHAGYYPGGYPISIKLLFSPKDGKVLGAQAVGRDGADKRIDVIATAMAADFTVYDLGALELCYAPPYSSTRDPVNYAGDIAANILESGLKQFFWSDCEDLAKRGEYILDARTNGEYQKGSIPGSVHIPLHELRKRIAEIPKDRKVYVFCQSGLRSYIASRMLEQLGVDAVNLSGGFLSWYNIAKEKGNV